MTKTRSPYLLGSERLADVIAAIQVMGTYKFYKMLISSWERRIGGPPRSSTAGWVDVFRDHPEFFRVGQDNTMASLIWRRARPKTFHVDRGLLTRAEVDALSEEERVRVSRAPLGADEIEALIDTAIELHHRAIVDQQERRWLVPLLIGVFGGLAAGLVSALIG